jgi:hypothetical protein
MTKDPRQLDLEDLLHYQDAPEFIGPRLPKDHPAYRAFLDRPTPTITPLPKAILGSLLRQETRVPPDDNDLTILGRIEPTIH